MTPSKLSVRMDVSSACYITHTDRNAHTQHNMSAVQYCQPLATDILLVYMICRTATRGRLWQRRRDKQHKKIRKAHSISIKFLCGVCEDQDVLIQELQKAPGKTKRTSRLPSPTLEARPKKIKNCPRIQPLYCHTRFTKHNKTTEPWKDKLSRSQEQRTSLLETRHPSGDRLLLRQQHSSGSADLIAYPCTRWPTLIFLEVEALPPRLGQGLAQVAQLMKPVLRTIPTIRTESSIFHGPECLTKSLLVDGTSLSPHV